MLQRRARPTLEVVIMSDFANMPAPASLTGSISSQRRYGATRLNAENTEMKFLTHVVQNGDTLQRIAVKYDVPVERLKHLNKIWLNESLFLLKTLKIPYIKHTSNWDDESDDEDESEASCLTENHNEVEKASESTGSDNEQGRSGTAENRAEPFNNPDDFFSKIDSQIHKCKEDWTKIRSHSQGSAGIPTVSYDSADLNRIMSPTKRYKHIGEEI